jgi:hypothetical protein
MYKPKTTFDSFLQEKFFEAEPQTLDDQFPDAFNDWLVDIDVQEIIDYGQEYAEYITKQNIKYALFLEDIEDNERRDAV